MLSISKKIKKYISSGHARNVAAKKNILKLVIVKIITIVASLLLIPITIKYVSPSDYGIWLVISSTIAWMSLFDIGVNNGLRNRLSESLAKNDIIQSKKLVSTTYALLLIIFIPLLFLLMAGNYFVDWASLFNLPTQKQQNLKVVAAILIAYFCVRFILSTVNTVLLATQNSAQAAYSGLFEQLSLLVLVYVISKTLNGSLESLALAVFLSSLSVLITYNIWVFGGKYKNIAPSISEVDLGLSKGLLSLGLKFFVIQIAGIIQFQTANIILIRNFGPTEVTEYNVAVKYFSIMPMIMGILLAPIWSAVTDAYAKQDYDWIHKTVSKYNKFALMVICLGIGMLFFSQIAYKTWINDERVNVEFALSAWLFILYALMAYGSVYSIVLNGLGVLRLQFIACIFSPVIFLILVFVFINYCKFGVEAIVISSIIANFNGYILGPWQYGRIQQNQKMMMSENIKKRS